MPNTIQFPWKQTGFFLTNTEPSEAGCNAKLGCCMRSMAMDGTPAFTREPAGAAGDDDRLSELPDCLLEDILSRLTSRQAACTSVLSRRWPELWRAVASRAVDIDQREFRRSEAIDVCAAEDPQLAMELQFRASVAEQQAFEDLGDTLLPPNGTTPPPLDRLRLRVACKDALAAVRWIRRGLARRPAAFDLCCDNDDTPRSLSEHKHRPCFPVVALPPRGAGAAAFACRLRTLRLAGLTLLGDFAELLAADFSALEDLQLEECALWFCRLASRSLRKLSVDRCSQFKTDVLVVAAPSIASLHIHGDGIVLMPPVTVEEGEMPSLATASLTDPAGELGVLRLLRHASSLSLTGFSTAALLGDEDPGDFPVFHNLRTLVLDGCDVGVECQVLQSFLRNAPCLEALTLRQCSFSGGSRSKKRKERYGEKTAYECKKLRSVELEFCDDHAVDELAQTLGDISKEAVDPMESSVQDRNCRVKISFA